MKNTKKILVTGASGKLGRAIISSGLFKSVISPDSRTMNLTDLKSIDKIVNTNNISHVIHCAAIARMSICEADPIKAIRVNIIGTSNLVQAIIKKEKVIKKEIRFIYISTDGVYESKNGFYSEDGPTVPYNKYGWSKLSAECVVRMLKITLS